MHFLNSLREKIKSPLIFLGFILFVFRTPKWVNRVYSRMCALDYEQLKVLPVGSLYAGAALVDYTPVAGKRFVIGEADMAQVYVHEEQFEVDKVVFKKVYRQNQYLKSVRWAWHLKKLHRYMKRSGLYDERDRELIEEMRKS